MYLTHATPLPGQTNTPKISNPVLIFLSVFGSGCSFGPESKMGVWGKFPHFKVDVQRKYVFVLTLCCLVPRWGHGSTGVPSSWPSASPRRRAPMETRVETGKMSLVCYSVIESVHRGLGLALSSLVCKNISFFSSLFFFLPLLGGFSLLQLMTSWYVIANSILQMTACTLEGGELPLYGFGRQHSTYC